MAQVRLTILVQEGSRDRYGQVVEDCRQAGLVVEQQLVSVGVITGCIDEERIPNLTMIAGVAIVETQRTLRGI